MSKTTKIIVGLLIAGLLAPGLKALPVLAEETTTTDQTLSSLMAIIESLKAQIAEIEAKITALQQNPPATKQEAKQEQKEVKAEVKTALQLTKQLRKGMRGADVSVLQDFLATDPDIYPEGLVTGYFGPLTEKAVKKFQQKMGVEQVGNVGPKTTEKINELLTEGAGNSGKVPPGLLIAPGIAKKIGYTPTPPEGQILPPGIAKKLTPATAEESEEQEEPDATAPVISDVSAIASTTSAVISWTTDEAADSKVYYSTSTPLDSQTSALTASAPGATLTLDHLLTISPLNASTTYYYLVSSADQAGNRATSSEHSFSTTATSSDSSL